MTTERLVANKALMRRLVYSFETGNVADTITLIDPEYIDHQGLGGTPLRGPEGFSQVVAAARQACPSLRVSIEDLVAEDDRVVARIRWYGKNPVGQVIDRETIDIVRLSAGRAVQHWGAEMSRIQGSNIRAHSMPASSPSSPDPFYTLRISVREFVQCVEALPETLWLTKIVNWAPRDVVAHLIGWNLYVREGCDLLRAGKTPAYLDDREHDYRHVNAASVERFASRDKRALLGELDASYQALERYLAELDAATWDADTGVRVNGRPVTIRDSVRAFARDYDNHRRRLEEWQAEIRKR